MQPHSHISGYAPGGSGGRYHTHGTGKRDGTGCNKDNGDQDVATRQASERSTANAECHVLDEDRKTFIEQLRRPECREAMVTAAQNASVGEEAYLAVQQILYQSSENAALELVTLTVTDEGTGVEEWMGWNDIYAAGGGDFDLPVPAGDGPHVAEDGGAEPTEQEPSDLWPSMLTCST